jgi:hypothetical protein
VAFRGFLKRDLVLLSPRIRADMSAADVPTLEKRKTRPGYSFRVIPEVETLSTVPSI